MKPWKQWSYWSRGATIAVVACVVLIFFESVITPRFLYGICGDTVCMPPLASLVQHVFNVIMYPLMYSVASSFFLENQSLFFIASLVYSFFVGAFIGLIYGKFKHGRHHV